MESFVREDCSSVSHDIVVKFVDEIFKVHSSGVWRPVLLYFLGTG